MLKELDVAIQDSNLLLQGRRRIQRRGRDRGGNSARHPHAGTDSPADHARRTPHERNHSHDLRPHLLPAPAHPARSRGQQQGGPARGDDDRPDDRNQDADPAVGVSEGERKEIRIGHRRILPPKSNGS